MSLERNKRTTKMQYTQQEISDAKALMCWHQRNLYNEIKDPKPCQMDFEKAKLISSEVLDKEAAREQYCF